jgi:UDP-N-acetylglucosamine 2-epimerase (non-hydrolysing)
MKTVLSIIGTRPEAIKMVPVIYELGKNKDKIKSIVVVTAQHREMLDQVLNLFEIHPDYDLGIMNPAQSLSELTSKLFSRLAPVVQEIEPDWILAQGDTTTVMVASLVAFYNKISFGHIEAGLRTGNIEKPFPEEMNRFIADKLSTLLFTPTELNRETLLSEGIPPFKILVTGNTIVDTLSMIVKRPYFWNDGPLASIPENKIIILVTAHRRENFGIPFREICMAIRDLSFRFKSDGIHFVYPVHMNPNIATPAYEMLSGLDNVTLTKPLDYLSLINLMAKSKIVLTDSGGIQEEAPSLGVPVLVMRDTTERQESIISGVAKLVGTKANKIFQETESLLTNDKIYNSMMPITNPYGDGKSSKRIVNALLSYPE